MQSRTEVCSRIDTLSGIKLEAVEINVYRLSRDELYVEKRVPAVRFLSLFNNLGFCND